MTTPPGWPGLEPRWTSSAKHGLGTALSATSRVWFTFSHGILNEVYYPRVDQACTRDFGLIVTGPDGYFSEEKRLPDHRVTMIEPGIPAYRLLHGCPADRFAIEKDIVCDPLRDTVLQRVVFTKAAHDPLRLYALLAPHLVNGGAHNTAWTGEYKGVRMLFAEGDGTALALAASVPFGTRSVGFVGTSDGWQQLSRAGEIMPAYDRAEDGNVALVAEMPVSGERSEIVLALSFGRSWSEAAFRARASLLEPFDEVAERYAAGWRSWQAGLRPLDGPPRPDELVPYRTSTTVLRCHESPTFPGGLIASLSIPWGSEKSDDDLGGYHLVWPRDLVQTAGGFLAAGAHDEAVRIIDYLRATQEPDGHWNQNSWLDGQPYWGGLQLDETGFPILLVDLASRCGALPPGGLARYWPMVEKAAAFLAETGPVTGQDRWEENGGYAPWTLAVVIAALLAAAEMADGLGPAGLGDALRAKADLWNANIDGWAYARDTPLAAELGIEGYYIRMSPPATGDGRPPWLADLMLKNRPADRSVFPASSIVSPDALGLVRFGLRRADDPRILDTVRAIDHLLKVELPAGPCWRRYNEDGYGEHPDGSAFDGTGIGRAWPLLAAERAHYELAAGRADAAAALLRTVESLTSTGGLMPEQVWDADDIPGRELVRGQPSGSAMPLVWAHAEHIKLIRSLADGRVFDTPPQTLKRYAGG